MRVHKGRETFSMSFRLVSNVICVFSCESKATILFYDFNYYFCANECKHIKRYVLFPLENL